MWKALRTRFERYGWIAPAYDRLTLSGRVRSSMIDEEELPEHRAVLLSVSIQGAHGSLHRLDADSRFRLELPLDRMVRVTIVLQGHLPRMVEVQPLRPARRAARTPLHARCEIDVTLTPRRTPEGLVPRPMLERITMPRDRRPLIVEWDHVMRAEQGEEFVPLFLRAV